MPPGPPIQADGTLRRPLAPRDAPRSAELIAGLALAALLAHLLLAQLTLVLTAVLYAAGRLARWRLRWLAAPAVAGALWALAVGPARAAAGLTDGPRHVLGYLGGIGQHPGRLLRLADAFSGLTHWLPEQLPLALILASAEAFGLCWLQMCWLARRRGGEPAWRTGLVVAARRRWTAAWIRSGGVVTRDGCCLGVDVTTGQPAAISWQEAEGGVLCAGPAGGLAAAAPSAEAQSGFMLAHAAIRRRKPVIVIDLAGPEWLAGSLAAASVEPGAPLSHFGPAGPGCYEPLRGGDPARAAALVMAMLDWSETGDQQRRSCAAYLTDALAVQAAAPRDRREPVLDDLVRLLTPQGLRERAALIPAYHPRRDVLADRVGVSADLLRADPAIAAVPSAQLPWLRSTALGRWLGPAPPGATRVSLGQTIRERGVAVFSLDGGAHGDAARMIAGLAVADLMAVGAELQGMSVPGDTVVWVSGCEVLGQQVLADLVVRGQAAGMAVVLGTASAAAADRLAAEVNVLIARGPADPGLVGRFAAAPAARAAAPRVAGPAGAGPGAGLGAGAELAFGINGGGGALAADVAALGAGAFALLARGPERRVLASCCHVPARVGGRNPVRAGPPGAGQAGAGAAGNGAAGNGAAGNGAAGNGAAGNGPAGNAAGRRPE
jgi:hypothetical protein